MDNVVQKV